MTTLQNLQRRYAAQLPPDYHETETQAGDDSPACEKCGEACEIRTVDCCEVDGGYLLVSDCCGEEMPVKFYTQTQEYTK